MPQNHPDTAMVALGASLSTSASHCHHPPRSCHPDHTVTATHLPVPSCSCHHHLRAVSSWQPLPSSPGTPIQPHHSVPSPEFHQPLPPESPITPQSIRVPFPLPLHIPLNLPWTSRLSHQRPRNPRPLEGAASRTARADSGGGGAAATVAFYEWGSGRHEASSLCRAARAAPQRGSPIGQAGR